MTLLSIIQEVTGMLSLPQPPSVVGNTDKQVIQLYNLLNEQGRDQASAAPWQALTEEARFTTVASPTQPVAIPTDLDRFIPNSFFNRSTRRPVTGPLTPKEWQWIQAQPVYTTAYLAFRERQGAFLMAPTPPVGQSIYYEYVSINWAKSSGGVPQAAFLADADTSYLDEHLLGQGLRWRFLKAKGLEYAEDKNSYEEQLQQAMARDGGSSILSLAPSRINSNRVNLPDGSFGR
jgi:hypothetical protein